TQDAQNPVRIGSPLQGHKGSVNSLAFSPDGETLASGGDDGALAFWNVRDPRKPSLIASLPAKGDSAVILNSAVWAWASPRFTAADCSLALWLAKEPISPGVSVKSVAFSRDGRTLAVAGEENLRKRKPFIRLWDVVTRQPLGGPLAGHQGGVVNSVA